jgi:integrase
MSGGRTKLGQAPILAAGEIRELLAHVASTSAPARDEVIVRLNVECGLRATEIGRVTWDMAFGPAWRLRPRLKLHRTATKGGYGGRELRIVPHGLGVALEKLLEVEPPRDPEFLILRFRKHSIDPVIRSKAVQAKFREWYDAIGLEEHSSHSGRRTSITLIARATGLKNAQTFAGHRSLATTARYEEPDHAAIDRVVAEQLVVNAPRVLRPQMVKASLRSSRRRRSA